MSILNDFDVRVTVGDFFDGCSIALFDQHAKHDMHLEDFIVDAFKSCEVDKWPHQFLSRVKSLLNAQIIGLQGQPHPFTDEITQFNISWYVKGDNMKAPSLHNLALFAKKEEHPVAETLSVVGYTLPTAAEIYGHSVNDA